MFWLKVVLSVSVSVSVSATLSASDRSEQRMPPAKRSDRPWQCGGGPHRQHGLRRYNARPQRTSRSATRSRVFASTGAARWRAETPIATSSRGDCERSIRASPSTRARSDGPEDEPEVLAHRHRFETDPISPLPSASCDGGPEGDRDPRGSGRVRSRAERAGPGCRSARSVPAGNVVRRGALDQGRRDRSARDRGVLRVTRW